MEIDMNIVAVIVGAILGGMYGYLGGMWITYGSIHTSEIRIATVSLLASVILLPSLAWGVTLGGLAGLLYYALNNGGFGGGRPSV